jgi:hypothetical protein
MAVFEKIPQATLDKYVPDGLGELFGDEEAMESPLAIQAFMERSWWNRTWTVQEVVLPRHVELLCGKSLINWESLSTASKCVLKHWASCCRVQYSGFGLGQGEMVASFAARIDTLETLRNLWRQVSKVNFIAVLAQFRSRLASCNHDKVYGLLGFASQEEREAIIPNYDCDVATAYAQPVVENIRKSSAYQALGHVLENKATICLPSWVPDWSTPPQDWENQLTRIKRYWLFNASGNIQSTGEIHGLRVISELGAKFDEISQVGELLRGPTSHRLAHLTMQRWGNIVQLEQDSCRVYAKDETIADAFGKTMMMDSFGGDERATEDVYTCWKAWWNSMCQNSEWIPDADHWFASDFREISLTVIASIVWRRFFVTKGGSIGIGPADTQVGDDVYVLGGGRQPLTLRKSETVFSLPGTEIEPQLCHTLVGDCYVHGIMDGEAATNLARSPTNVFIV